MRGAIQRHLLQALILQGQFDFHYRVMAIVKSDNGKPNKARTILLLRPTLLMTPKYNSEIYIYVPDYHKNY